MKPTHILSWEATLELVSKRLPKKGLCYGVPRGGAVVAALTGRMVDRPEQADFIVDDIVDSGKTRRWWNENHRKPFFALVDKTGADKNLGWVTFPWEHDKQTDAQDAVVRLLQHIGEDPNREGLRDTPKRVVKAWGELTSGYAMSPATILERDFDGGGYDEMIAVPNVEFFSTCEHHMLPFYGVAHVAYIPRRRVVGLSKLARLVDCFGRRLQIQEQMTNQIAEAIQTHLDPLGVAVVVQARHLCMCARGVGKHKSSMVTSSMRGAFKKKGEARAEFFSLVNLKGEQV